MNHNVFNGKNCMDYIYLTAQNSMLLFSGVMKHDLLTLCACCVLKLLDTDLKKQYLYVDSKLDFYCHLIADCTETCLSLVSSAR